MRIADVDPDAELSIVVLKNVYDAQSVYAGPRDDTAAVRFEATFRLVSLL